jgi:TonB-linked SusC/RagA family outer membrane protein
MRSFGRVVLYSALLALVPLSAGAAQQQVTVTFTGRVETVDQAPIAGAVVSLVGLPFSTVVRSDGQYTLLVPAARLTPGGTVTLLARAISYKPISAPLVVNADTLTHDFQLPVNPLQLGEIVVTGAGTTQEVEKLGSVRNYVDSSLIVKSAEPNLVNALAAKAPNVEVLSSAGDPGASSSIVIRGINTFSGTSQPLFVVDGMPIDNSTITTTSFDGTGFGDQQGTYAPNRGIDLNPADIENIEVLKGAAAGAVYGARAGQGVILITTRRGRPGTTTYSLSTSLSVNNVTRFPTLQREYGQGNGGVTDTCGGLDCGLTTRSWGAPIPAGTPTYDHSQEVFRTGYTFDNTMTISGGNDRTTFYFSGSYMNQTGTFVGPNNRFDRKSFRLKADHRLSDQVKVSGNISYANSNGDYVQKGSNFSGILLGSWRATPTFDNRVYLDPVTKIHRSYSYPEPSANSFDQSRGYDNPFFVAYQDVSNSLTDRIIGNTSVDWQARSWLRFNYTLGVDAGADSRLQGQAQTSSNTPLATGQVIKLDINNSQVDMTALGVATWSRGKNLAGEITIGSDLNSRTLRILGGVGNGLIAPAPFSLGNTGSQLPAVDSIAKIRTNGVFGQLTTDLYEQLHLKAGLRYDGASTYSSKNLRSWFPSLSAAWQFNKVSGDLGGILTYGKARVAYGEVGTQPSPYLTDFIFKAGGSFADPYGPIQTPSGGLFTPTVKPATDLKPERTKEFETGVDLGLFKDYADLSFTWYRRKSTDVILQVQAAASSGYQTQWANAASLRNSGTEWALNVRPITTRDVQWEVGFILGTNRSRTLSLKGADQVNFGGLGGFGIAVAQVGLPVGVFYDYDFVRCGRGVQLDDGSGGVYDVDANCSSTQRKSHALFIADANLAAANGLVGGGSGFPLLDPNRHIVGDPNPKWTGSIRTSFTYKNLTVSGLVDIKHGGVIYNGTRGALMELGTSQESADLRDHPDRTFGQTILNGPVAGPGAGQQITLTEDWIRGNYTTFTAMGAPFYEDGSFVKLREVSVTYNWTGPVVRERLGLSSIAFRIGGRNLLTHTNYTGSNPEPSLGGADSPARGVDWFSNPEPRSFVFAVTINR